MASQWRQGSPRDSPHLYFHTFAHARRTLRNTRLSDDAEIVASRKSGRFPPFPIRQKRRAFSTPVGKFDFERGT